jgi:hypothetical protein
MTNRKRPHINKNELLARLRSFLGGMENSEENLNYKEKMEAETREKLEQLSKAILAHDLAKAEARQAAENLHKVMEESCVLLRRLDSWAYSNFGKKSVILSRFGKRAHRRSGPKGPHKHKKNGEGTAGTKK